MDRISIFYHLYRYDKKYKLYENLNNYSDAIFVVLTNKLVISKNMPNDSAG